MPAKTLVHIEEKVRKASKQGGLAYIYVPFGHDKTLEILSHAKSRDNFNLMGYTVKVHKKKPQYNKATNKIGIFLMVEKHG